MVEGELKLDEHAVVIVEIGETGQLRRGRSQEA